MVTSLNKPMRYLTGFLACTICLGQAPQSTDDLPKRSDIIVQLNVVIAPTTVLDRQGNYINGLSLDDFKLYDNNKPQRITADIGQEPLSLVVAVQASSMLTDVLPKIQHIGTMLDDLIIGQNGEVAVLAFDHRIRVVQDFTSDPGKIQVAMKNLTAGSSTSALVDAETQAVRMLSKRLPDHRRVLLLISEKRDKGSEGKLREALTATQLANVTVYSIDISHFVAQITGHTPMPAPDPFPATAQHVPAGGVQTPTSVDTQLYAGNYIPMFVDIFKAGKSLFIDDTLDVFTRYTGGKEYSFIKQKDLEKAVTALGEELHSQYLLSYTPTTQDEGGYHDIRVEVNRPRLEVRTRPGYWVAARP
jgi:VWFA-related protein